jgi:hypothetical protein
MDSIAGRRKDLGTASITSPTGVRGLLPISTDEQVSPTQILVLPVVPLPGRGGESGRPDPDGVFFPPPDGNFRRRHLLPLASLPVADSSIPSLVAPPPHADREGSPLFFQLFLRPPPQSDSQPRLPTCLGVSSVLAILYAPPSCRSEIAIRSTHRSPKSDLAALGLWGSVADCLLAGYRKNEDRGRFQAISRSRTVT